MFTGVEKKCESPSRAQAGRRTGTARVSLPFLRLASMVGQSLMTGDVKGVARAINRELDSVLRWVLIYPR